MDLLSVLRRIVWMDSRDRQYYKTFLTGRDSWVRFRQIGQLRFQCDGTSCLSISVGSTRVPFTIQIQNTLHSVIVEGGTEIRVVISGRFLNKTTYSILSPFVVPRVSNHRSRKVSSLLFWLFFPQMKCWWKFDLRYPYKFLCTRTIRLYVFLQIRMSTSCVIMNTVIFWPLLES